jgi:hypothetical protein
MNLLRVASIRQRHRKTAESSSHSEGASDFVKRSGNGDDHFEVLEQSFGVSAIKCVADVEEQTRRRLDRRYLLHIRRRAPRQD